MHTRRLARPAWLTGRVIRAVDAVSLLLGTLLLAFRFLEFHRLLAPVAAPTLDVLRASLPHAPPAGYGWWSWWDQSWYIESALAWARLDLDPALHWYPPGYPLLGALFSSLTPADPFTEPDLLCLVGSMWLFAAIAGQVLGRAPLGRSLGAWLFVAINAGSKRMLWAWVVPWTTTPETVCLLICLLGTIRFTRQATRWDAALAGFGAAATLAFRPADAAVVGGVCAAVALCALVVQRPGWQAGSRIAVAALAGAAVPIVGFGAAYLAVNGLRADGYLTVSAAYGFEWRLLPLRWVIIMIDPQPLFIDGNGLAQVFPWIATGLAGMLACVGSRLVCPGIPRLAHWAVLAGVMLDTLQFVCYRDLHPDFLWQNGIYHYFKWTLPFFGLYTLALLRALLAGPRLVPALALAAVIPGLFMWRVGVSDPVALASPADDRTLSLPHGLSNLRDVLFVRTAPGQTALIPFGSEIRSSDRTFRSTYDFKLTPWSETLMVQPLRPMPDAQAVLVVPPFSYALDTMTPPVLAHTAIQWGLPCWDDPRRASCRTAFPLPAPNLATGRSVRFGTRADGEVYRLAGLSPAEPEGDWTDGERATLWFRLAPGAGPLAIEMSAHGFVPLGGPARVTAYVNGVEAGRWRFGAATETARSTVPPSALRPDGNVVLDLIVASPRAPSHYSATSDSRALGIQLHSLRITEARP